MTRDTGQVVTFYSYKGGVGRSMALANVATLLSRWGYRTLVVDWDLEAPGIENYFQPHLGKRKIRLKGGVVELLDEARRGAAGEPGRLRWRDYLVKFKLPRGRTELHLLGAGVVDEHYFGRLRGFDLDSFYLEKRGGYVIEALRDEWRQAYDFVLVDSRTGVTDLGGVCTIQLPDTLVLLFTSNEQNVSGTAEAGRSAVRGRRKLPFDRVKLMTLPVASRFDADTEFALSEGWLKRAADELADLYADWLPPDLKPVEALKLTLLPYKPYFSFGEQLAVVEEETATSYTLSYAYETLAALLVQNLSGVEQLKSNRDTFVKMAVRATPKSELRPVAFLSYVHSDDRYGHVSKFHERLQDEVLLLAGTEFPIFHDSQELRIGEKWRRRLEESLDEATFLIPVITPSYFNSAYCREELRRFLEREKKLRRNDLVLPVYFIDTPLLNEPELRAQDELAQAIAERQYLDWRGLRYEPFTNPLVGRTLERLAVQLRDALPGARRRRPTPGARGRALPAPRRPGADAEEVETASAPSRRTKAEPPTSVVDPMSRGDFLTISDAISKSAPGTRILVRPGLYSEGLVVDKPLEIIGDGEPGEVLVQASDGHVLLFQATMGRITNLALRQMGGGFWYGVDIVRGRLELEDCDIMSRGLACVAIHVGADPRLRRNRIHDGRQGGVVVHEGGLGTLEDNDIFANGSSGVQIKAGGRLTLRRNRIVGNLGAAITIEGNGGGLFENNDLRGNTETAWRVEDVKSAVVTSSGNLDG